MGKRKRITQNDAVLKYMRDHGGITSMEAFRDLDITRLSGRIFDLKKDGHIIGSDTESMINKSGAIVRYSRYFLQD